MFNSLILSLFLEPRNMRVLADAHAVGRAGMPGEGPYMWIHVKMDGDRVADIGFETYGCPGMVACGSWLTEWAKGRTVEQVLAITPDDLARVLGGVPLGKEHWPRLAVEALRAAVRGTGNRE